MIDVAATLPAGFGQPSTDDVEQAKNHLNSGQIHASKDPKVLELQVKLLARAFSAKRQGRNAFQKVSIVDSPEEIAKQERLNLVSRSHEASTAMMGPGTRYSGISFYDPGVVENGTVRFLRSTPASFLLLLGGTGCGKTRGAVCWVSERSQLVPVRTDSGNIDRRLNAKFVNAYEVWLHLHYRDKDFLREIEVVKYLILDDLVSDSADFKTKDLNKYVEYLFSVRHRNNLPMVMTCNETAEGIRAFLGDRFLSRFNEVGEYFESKDPDMRLRNC